MHMHMHRTLPNTDMHTIYDEVFSFIHSQCINAMIVDILLWVYLSQMDLVRTLFEGQTNLIWKNRNSIHILRREMLYIF
jgi:hypothetical protein